MAAIIICQECVRKLVELGSGELNLCVQVPFSVPKKLFSALRRLEVVVIEPVAMNMFVYSRTPFNSLNYKAE